METSIGDCEARYSGEVASTRVHAVLAPQVTGQAGRPPIVAETIALTEEVAINNRTWRANGFRANCSSFARRGLLPVRRGRTWATFIQDHAGETWACDFVQTYDVLFRAVFAFFIIELGSRRVVHSGVTRSPSGGWVAEQVRNATP